MEFFLVEKFIWTTSKIIIQILIDIRYTNLTVHCILYRLSEMLIIVYIFSNINLYTEPAKNARVNGIHNIFVDHLYCSP